MAGLKIIKHAKNCKKQIIIKIKNMKLGAFSVSLSVKDISASNIGTQV
jgi:hypothetical protein